MSNAEEWNGRCLCGAVRVTATAMNGGIGACHCDMCRRWGGGPFLAVDCGADLRIDGVENVSVFDSSEWAERAFCARCGSHVFYRVKQTGQHIVAAGLFEGELPVAFDHQVFIDEKPPYYAFSNDTRDMTGAEVFAMFAAPPDD